MSNKSPEIQSEPLPIPPWMGELITAMQPVINALPALNKVVGAALQKLPNVLPAIQFGLGRVNEFPEAIREGSTELAKLGWFYDLSFPLSDSFNLRDLARRRDVAAIDAYFIGHYERSGKELEKQLVFAYPNRAPILQQAFQAADLGMYYVAIPVLLAQADGLSLDIIGGKLFRSVKKRPEAAGKLDDMQLEDFTKKFLAALQQNSGFNAAEEYRHEFPDAPNRHDILHGRDLIYGNHRNYWKAMSLLAFIGLHVPEILKDGK